MAATTTGRPYTWRVGVDNAFGYLTLPGGTRHLAESRRFQSHRGISRGVAIDLDTGAVILADADGSATWQPLEPERACELAGIPEPAVDGVAETARRLDPFHVERHTSATFLAIVATAGHRTLPCAHALRAWLAGAWDGTFDAAYLEQPETFAASVLERIGDSGQPPASAVIAQLAADTALASDQAPETIAVETGWADAVRELPDRIRELALALERARSTRRADAGADRPQLSLL
jgi:hypothetical protein